METNVEEKKKGLYPKYHVVKSSTGEVIEDCIVLEFKDPIAQPAIEEWANQMYLAEYHKVYHEVIRKLSDMGFPRPKEEKVKFEVATANDYVLKTSDALLLLLRSMIRHIDDGQQWLIASRVVNRLFSCHFSLTVAAAEKEIISRQEVKDAAKNAIEGGIIQKVAEQVKLDAEQEIIDVGVVDMANYFEDEREYTNDDKFPQVGDRLIHESKPVEILRLLESQPYGSYIKFKLLLAPLVLKNAE